MIQVIVVSCKPEKLAFLHGCGRKSSGMTVLEEVFLAALAKAGEQIE